MKLRLVVAAIAAVVLARPISALEWHSVEGVAHGFPVMRDASGTRIADGDFTQWSVNDRTHVRIAYDFPGGRRVVEEVVFRQHPELAQEAWAFHDMQGKQVLRAFAVNFNTGEATASKVEDGETRHYAEKLDIVRGQTFAGFGFTLAMKALRDRLVKGETVTLKGVGFTPKPQVVSTDVSYMGRDRLRMEGRTIDAEHFIVHPKIPAIAKLFVKVPDASIWLTTAPAGFFRWEGAMAEPDDQMIRVDLF